MPCDISHCLKNKQYLQKGINVFANIVVAALRQYSNYIPMTIFRHVAKQAADKFPDSFLEKDRQGNLISNVLSALLSKMKNRNNTCNRAPKRKISAYDLNIPLNARRKVNILQQTCVNWQPGQSSSGDSSGKFFVLLFYFELVGSSNKFF